MCQPVLQKPFTADHVCQMVRRVYEGKVTFHNGEAEIAPGVSVHKVGGHSRGLQAVRVETANGPLVLASDAAHYYETYETRNPFPLVVDMEDMLKGYDLLTKLAGDRRLVIPGHDPQVRQKFPIAFANARPEVWRLDLGTIATLKT
jgi:glyoxylase-like metal-dependent hydrolase (beta-lactamase superfamily II)